MVLCQFGEEALHRLWIWLTGVIVLIAVIFGVICGPVGAAAPEAKRAPTVAVTPPLTATPCSGPSPTVIGFPTHPATIAVTPLHTEVAPILQPTGTQILASALPARTSTKIISTPVPTRPQITPTRRSTYAIVVPQSSDTDLLERLSWLSAFQVLAVIVVLVVLVVGSAQMILRLIQTRPVKRSSGVTRKPVEAIVQPSQGAADEQQKINGLSED